MGFTSGACRIVGNPKQQNYTADWCQSSALKDPEVKTMLRAQQHLLHVKDEVSDAAVERSSHPEHHRPLTLWDAPYVQVGHIYCRAFH